jgi:hypothetical protein
VLDKPVPHDKCEPLEEYVPGHGKGRQQGFLLPGLDSNQQPLRLTARPTEMR